MARTPRRPPRARGNFNGIGDALLRADLAAGLRPRDTAAVGVSEADGRDLLALTVDQSP